MQGKYNLHVGFHTVEPERFKPEQTQREHYNVTALEFCHFTLHVLFPQYKVFFHIRRQVNKLIALSTAYKVSQKIIVSLVDSHFNWLQLKQGY